MEALGAYMGLGNEHRLTRYFHEALLDQGKDTTVDLATLVETVLIDDSLKLRTYASTHIQATSKYDPQALWRSGNNKFITRQKCP